MITSDSAYDAEISKHYRRNFIVNVLDTSIGGVGFSFMSSGSILPLFVSRLTSSSLIIGLIGTLSALVWLPQVFTARWVERLPRKKPFVAFTTLLGERLAIVATALVVWGAHIFETRLTLILFFLAFTYHTLGAGMVITAWQELMAKIIPVRARGRFFGVSFFGMSALSLVAASAATAILARYPFPTNFAICFTVAAVCVMVSFLFFLATHEPARPDPRPPTTGREYWQNLFILLRQDANFRRYLVSQVAWAFGGMGRGFIAVYAARRFGLPDQVAGTFTAILVASQMVANLTLGELADRRGHKLTLELASLALLAAMAVAFVGESPLWFYVSFVFLGIGAGGNIVSSLSITMEFSQPESRPTYIGLANTTLGVAMLVAPLLAGWIAGWAGYPALFALSMVGGVVTFIVLHWWVREPRHADSERVLTGG
ncbi:MAG: MFS transporter [Anaerolineae bacterium]|nr:MFS transporter [Anaerolineae bacterium]